MYMCMCIYVCMYACTSARVATLRVSSAEQWQIMFKMLLSGVSSVTDNRVTPLRTPPRSLLNSLHVYAGEIRKQELKPTIGLEYVPRQD